MSDPVQPAMPPVPPRPPARHGVLIALLVLALIVICAAAALIFGVRVISQNVSVHKNGADSVSIRTPVGNLAVNQGKEVDPALIGLPLYPGAQRIHGNQSGATVQMSFPSDQGGVELGVIAAKFQTPDSRDKVAGYYRDQLGSRITKIKHDDNGRQISFEMNRGSVEQVVGLKSNGSGTEITLVRVRHDSDQAN